MVVVDLEDSVRPEDKGGSRDMLRAKLPNVRRSINGELCIRINPLWTEDGELDLAAFQDCIVMVPKIYTQEELDKLQNVQEFIPIFETIASLRHNFAFEMLDKWEGRVRTILYGKEDLLTDIGRINPDANTTNPVPSADLRKNWYMYSSFIELVKEVKDTGQVVEILDGISRDIEPESREDFKDEVKNAVQLGATGKISIYPWQIGAINDAFSGVESGSEAARAITPKLSVEIKNIARKLKNAKRIVEAFEGNTNPQNAAAVDIDGRRMIIGPPTYKLCLKLLGLEPKKF